MGDYNNMAKCKWKLKILFNNGLATTLNLANRYTQEEMEIMAATHRDCLMSNSSSFMFILVECGGHAYYRYKDIMGFEFLFAGFDTEKY